jgi:hypothetical protein
MNTYMTGDLYRAMLAAAKQYCDEEMVDMTDIGQARCARVAQDTHAGLPLPQTGDIVFEGTVDGVRREFLVREYAVVWSRPIDISH